MRKLRSPIWWFGGKGRMRNKIIPYLKAWPHKRYVEPFGGGANLLLIKAPVEVEVYNDLNEGLTNFFRVLSDRDMFDEFYCRVSVLPYSRALYNEYRDTWDKQDDVVLRAAQWFVVARQAFGGKFDHSWGSAVTVSGRGIVMTTAGWLSTIDLLPDIHARLQRVQIECQDWRKILERYDTPGTLFYCDPPYVQSTRRGGRYKYEMTERDHVELVEALLSIEGAAVLSGYGCDIYNTLEHHGWVTVTFDVACCAVGRTKATGLQGKGACDENQRRTECLWVHPKVTRGRY